MGEDTQGRTFSTVNDFWNTEVGSDEDRKKWYTKSLNFWATSKASVDGVLSGHSSVSEMDLNGSCLFLKTVKDALDPSGDKELFSRVLDCGAGIGRVTKGCLSQFFYRCDVLEPVPHFLEAAKMELKQLDGVEHFYTASLQDFQPPQNVYSCFWLQWCILYLVDDDLVVCLKRLRDALKPNGVICIKENVILSGHNFYYDRDDNSLMRTDSHYRDIFREAGLQLLFHMRQPQYPKGLIPVMMYCLR